MSYRKRISINSVLLDAENARHGDKASQDDILAWMSSGPIGQKVFRLATEIAKNGTSPLETPALVKSAEGEAKSWVVVEGNRRVAALKFLNNPKKCPDVKLRKSYEKLKSSAETEISSKIEFVIFSDIEAARYWIEVRHGGENSGAGIIPWGPMEFDNFSARFGKKTNNRPAVELISYAYGNGLITASEADEIPVTTLSRLLSNPLFRERLGCSLVDKSLFKISTDEYFNPIVTILLKKLANKKINVTKLKSKDQRESFAEELLRESGNGTYERGEATPLNGLVVKLDDLNESDESVEEDLTGPNSKGVKGSMTQKRSGLRDRLFTPRGHGLQVPDKHLKVHDILRELATLKHTGKFGTPISVAFLLRALIELSVDNYIKNNIGVIRNPEAQNPLRDKIRSSAKHMNSSGGLSQDQLETVLKYCNGQDLTILNVGTLQKYLHSDSYFPSGETLNSMWSEVKDFITSCW